MIRDRVRAVAAVAMLAGLAAAGCDRSPRFVQQTSDSTAVSADSSQVRVREAQRAWESGAGADAARLTARIVAERLDAAADPDAWKPLVDHLLDSLGVGFESAYARCGLAVNFFSRSDPAAGSWPYLFTCTEAHRIDHAPVEGRDMRLVALATRSIPYIVPAPGDSIPPEGAAALFERRAGAGHQPVLMVWGPRKGRERWPLVQTLGADSLGGFGGGQFVTTPEGVALETRTYQPPRFFAECATCPHVHRIRRFGWSGERFTRAAPDSVVPSPYATFVAFIHAIASDDRDAAEEWITSRDVLDLARQQQWSRPQGSWRVAPSSSERANPLVFYRGDREAYRVTFVPGGDRWLIDEIVETSRSLE